MPTPRLMRRIRKDRGYTLQSLAREIGTTHATVRNYEVGRIKEGRPSVRAALERALGVPIEVLLMEDSPGKENDPTLSSGAAGAATAPTRATEEGAVDES